MKLLTNYNYGPLLREGVRIYEYTPGFIHAKQVLTENSVIVGTINSIPSSSDICKALLLG